MTSVRTRCEGNVSASRHDDGNILMLVFLQQELSVQGHRSAVKRSRNVLIIFPHYENDSNSLLVIKGNLSE